MHVLRLANTKFQDHYQYSSWNDHKRSGDLLRRFDKPQKLVDCCEDSITFLTTADAPCVCLLDGYLPAVSRYVNR